MDSGAGPRCSGDDPPHEPQTPPEHRETKTGKKAPYFSQGTHLASDFWPAVL